MLRTPHDRLLPRYDFLGRRLPLRTTRKRGRLADFRGRRNRRPRGPAGERFFRPNIDLPPDIEGAVAFHARVAFTVSPAAEARVERNRFGDTRADVQRERMELAGVEIDDALEVLAIRATGPIHPDATAPLEAAPGEIEAALSAPNASTRQNHISNALSRVMNARDLFESNIDCQLGQGNPMY